jgi:hypothetical protein
LCREEGLGLASRFVSSLPTENSIKVPTEQIGEYNKTKVRLIGIIKEVAPIKGVETDAELGVDEFHKKYFFNYPLYVDSEREFFKYLGNKSLLGQKLHTWNPFRLYSDFQTLQKRIDGLEGNLKGEGLVKGGIVLLHPTKGVVYSHGENTGSVLPFDQIKVALKSLQE